jgi:hypothetical protein
MRCICGKEIAGPVREGPSWEQMAELADRHGWRPVIVGDAVGASTGTHFYACSETCQQNWRQSL